jgi:hypothetical protein
MRMARMDIVRSLIWNVNGGREQGLEASTMTTPTWGPK